MPKVFSNNNEKMAMNRPNKKSKVVIPKIIMQTWKNTQVPDHWKRSPESIKQHMSDWQYVLMTDDDNRKFVEIGIFLLNIHRH